MHKFREAEPVGAFYHKKPIRLAVEGNMGVGKTTLLKYLQTLPDFNVLFEPVEQWRQQQGGQNLFDMYFKDLTRWSFTFQTNVLITRAQSIFEHEKSKLKKHELCGSVSLFERSLFCDRYCFAHTQYQNGNMSPLEWALYQNMFLWLTEDVMPSFSGLVYLRLEPEVAFQRVQKRNRFEEKIVPLGYMQQLHQKHEEWLIEKKDVPPSIKNVPVLVIDATQDFETDKQVQAVVVETIRDFIKQLVQEKRIVASGGVQATF